MSTAFLCRPEDAQKGCVRWLATVSTRLEAVPEEVLAGPLRSRRQSVRREAGQGRAM